MKNFIFELKSFDFITKMLIYIFFSILIKLLVEAKINKNKNFNKITFLTIRDIILFIISIK